MRLSWVVLCLVWLVAPARVHSQAVRRATLHFTRGEEAAGCVGPIELAERVEEYTGPVLVTPSQAEIAIEAHVRRTGRSSYAARITLHEAGAEGMRERVLEHRGPDCAGFDEALAFVIATMIDPDLDLARLSGLLDAEAKDPGAILIADLERDPPVPAEVDEPRAERQPPPKEPKDGQPLTAWRSALALGAAVASDLPTPALGAALDVSLRRSWLELRVGGRTLFGVRAEELAPERRITSQLFASSLLVGVRAPRERRFGASLLVGPDVVLTRIVGYGFDMNRAATLATWAGRVRGGALVKLSASLALELAASMRFTGMERQFVVDQPIGQPVAFETRKLTYGASLSLEYSF